MPGTLKALFGYNEKQSFGLIWVRVGVWSFTSVPDHTVTYRIVSIDNEVKADLVLQRSELAHAGTR